MEQKQNTNNKRTRANDLEFFQNVLGMFLKESMDAPKELKIVYDGVLYGLTSAFTILVNPDELPHDVDNAITALGVLMTKKESGQQLRKIGVETMDSIAEKCAKDLGTTLKDVMNMSPEELRKKYGR